jgi:hypothetical protein
MQKQQDVLHAQVEQIVQIVLQVITYLMLLLVLQQQIV